MAWAYCRPQIAQRFCPTCTSKPLDIALILYLGCTSGQLRPQSVSGRVSCGHGDKLSLRPERLISMRVFQANWKVRRLNAVLWLVVFMGWPCLVNAQSWSGILSSSRATDWSQAGVVGGIPSASWTQCGPTITPPSSAAAIQAAINSCGTNQYVFLAPGTFTLSTGINMRKSNMVLRGSGANQTILSYSSSGNNGCYSYFALICINNDLTVWGSTNTVPGGTNGGNWTGGYSQGATSITVSNIGSAGIKNGQYVYLSQANDTTVGSNLFTCDLVNICALEGGSPGQKINGVDYSQLQVVKVTAGCSTTCTGAGPFTLTITPGLYGQSWRSSQTPDIWWTNNLVQYVGVENLTIDAGPSNMGDNGELIGIYNAANCWVSGVALHHGSRAGVWIVQAAHNTIQNNYFYQTQNATSQSYGVEEDLASDNLVVNNIMQQVTSAIIGGSQFGNTFAYNYMINAYQTASLTCMYQPNLAHDAGAMYNLAEGNFANGISGDDIHGSSGVNTLFRNVFQGFELTRSCFTIAIAFDPYNRDENVIGNVLGTPGKTTTYGDPANQTFGIYNIAHGHGQMAADPLVHETMLRWGNYDNVTGTVRWCGNSSDTGWSTTCASTSELPTGISSYANAVPSYGDTGAGQSPMPASFIYSSKPSWWPSGKPWPPVGPDVTNGNIGQCVGGSYPAIFATAASQCIGGTFSAHVNGGHAYSIPAMDCYFSMGGPPDGSGNALSFNAGQCYATEPRGAMGPAPPTGLTVTVN